MGDCSNKVFRLNPHGWGFERLNRTSCHRLNSLLDSHRNLKVVHSQNVWNRVWVVCVEAVDGKADVDVFELIRLWLPILVSGLPFAIAKVIHKILGSYEIGAFHGEVPD